MINKRKSNNLIKRVDQSINRLPVEIIMKIFDYLSPRQLCTCTYVCKQWYMIASSNEIWRKLFHYYHINRPSRDKVTFKQEFIKRSREFMREKLLKDIDFRFRQHLFPDFSELRRLDISIIGEIFDFDKRLINRNSQRVKTIICDTHSGVRFNWQRMIYNGQFPELDDIAAITITLVVPGLIKNLIPFQETINNHIKMLTFDLRASIRMIKSRHCGCQDSSHNFSSPIDWHFCVPTMLIGLRYVDQSVAYLCSFLPLMDMQATTEKFLFGGRHDSSYLTQKCRVSEPQLLRFRQPNCATDLKCTLILENIEPSSTLMVKTWTSLDYFEEKSFDLVKLYDEHTHIQMNDNIVFLPTIGNLHLEYKNMIKIEVLIVSARNFPLWSYSAAVVLSTSANMFVDCNYPDSTQWVFDDDVVKGTLTLVDNRRMYLTHFCIR